MAQDLGDRFSLLLTVSNMGFFTVENSRLTIYYPGRVPGSNNSYYLYPFMFSVRVCVCVFCVHVLTVRACVYMCAHVFKLPSCSLSLPPFLPLFFSLPLSLSPLCRLETLEMLTCSVIQLKSTQKRCHDRCSEEKGRRSHMGVAMFNITLLVLGFGLTLILGGKREVLGGFWGEGGLR